MDKMKKKVKYVEKPITDFFKKEQIVLKENSFIKENLKKQIIMQDKQTNVINVKVTQLRKNGYNNLIEWLDNPDHVYIGRHNHYVKGAIKSKWANPFKVK